MDMFHTGLVIRGLIVLVTLFLMAIAGRCSRVARSVALRIP